MRTNPILSAAFIATLALAGAAPAYAAESKGGHGGGASSGGAGNRYQASWTLAVEPEEAEPEADDSPSLVEFPVVVVPIAVDGRLVNYAFISMRLDVADGNDPWKVREQTTRLRDALLRAAHAEPLNAPGDPSGIDRAKTRRVFTAAANRVLGGEVVRDVRIMNVDARFPDLAPPR